MIKKTFTSFAFFALIQVFIFSCCNDEYNVYYEALDFTAIDSVDGDASMVSSESLILNFSPMYEYILVSNFAEFNKFSNAAYATTCDENYNYKETVTNVTVSANVDLFGISAGNALNEKLSYKNPETLENEDFEAILNVLNREDGYARYGNMEIVLNETIPADTAVSFTIEVQIVENDRTLEASTEMITIE